MARRTTRETHGLRENGIIRLIEGSDLPVRVTLRLLGLPRSTFYGRQFPASLSTHGSPGPSHKVADRHDTLRLPADDRCAREALGMGAPLKGGGGASARPDGTRDPGSAICHYGETSPLNSHVALRVRNRAELGRRIGELARKSEYLDSRVASRILDCFTGPEPGHRYTCW